MKRRSSSSSDGGVHSRPQFSHGKQELSFDGYYGYNNNDSIEHDHRPLLQLQEDHQQYHQVPASAGERGAGEAGDGVGGERGAGEYPSFVYGLLLE
jgi:hypothetical protein